MAERLMDKVKGAIGTKKVRMEAKKKAGYSPETKEVLAKIPGSEVKPAPKARKEFTDTAMAELKTGKRPEKPAPMPVAKQKAAPATKKSSSAFPTYKKDSAQAKSFRSAFAAANKAGKKTFSWEGRTYSTAKKK